MQKKSSYGHIKTPLARVHLELTNICDFNCVFCPKSEMNRSYGHIDTNLAKDIIKELGQNKICTKITFHVMGEPTLHPDFFEILEFTREQGLKIGLTTNGAGLGGKIGKKLLNYPLYQLDVSLQTPDSDSFSLRKAGKLSFEDYSRNVLDFFTSYNSRNPDTIFKFRFLNTSLPVKEIEDKTGPIKIISSTRELQNILADWTTKLYKCMGISAQKQTKALEKIYKLSSYRWNVVEISPNIFLETYLLDSWGHAFEDQKIYKAWGGYCYGMRDHFSILYNGDVILCCKDFNGKTAIGNLHKKSLKEILSSARLAQIINGFKKNKLIHPYCKRCMGSTSFLSWLIKPVSSLIAYKLMKPFFHKNTKLF
jgi:radical SAM protein with 4Fe4S-binding SPASM domain